MQRKASVIAPSTEVIIDDLIRRELVWQHQSRATAAQDLKDPALNLTGVREGALTKHYTDDPAAYQLFLSGRYFFNQRGGSGSDTLLNKSLAFLEQAIANNPSFALAYAAEADMYNVISSYGAMKPNESFPKAKMAALHATELDDTLAEAHAMLAKVKAHYDWDWPGAAEEFRRSFELNPNYANGHYYYALNYLIPVGRSDEALKEMRRAEELDPSSTII